MLVSLQDNEEGTGTPAHLRVALAAAVHNIAMTQPSCPAQVGAVRSYLDTTLNKIADNSIG